MCAVLKSDLGRGCGTGEAHVVILGILKLKLLIAHLTSSPHLIKDGFSAVGSGPALPRRRLASCAP